MINKKIFCYCIGFFWALLFFVFIPLRSYSQAPTPADIERVTRQEDIFDKEQKEKIEQELKAPPKKPIFLKPEESAVVKEGQKFFVKKIILVGCENVSLEVFASNTQKYENKEVSLAQLETLAKGIEREYLRQGIISAVFVPPQEVKDDTVTLRVVEAKMGSLEIQKHKYFKKERIAYYWIPKHGKVLRYDEISKSIQLMNKNPDREVRAALAAGKKPGTTDVILTPKTSFPIHITSSYDNEGAASTGRSRVGVGLKYNNFLGFDDSLILGENFGRDFCGTYAYHTLPVSRDGASLMYGYSHSESTPTKDYTVQGIKSEAKGYSFSLNQDIYKKDEYLGEVSFGFDAKDKTAKIASGTINRDRLRILHIGGSFTQRGLGSNTTVSSKISQGIKGLGASRAGNPMASRNAKSTFSKLELNLQHKKALPLNLQASFKVKSQLSSGRLMSQEQFYLGGMDSIRGYPAGDFAADNAVQSNAELLIPSIFIPANWRLPYAESTLRDQITSLIFIDYGYGLRRGALPTENRTMGFLGMGAGIRGNFFNQALVRLEWGFPVADDSITEAGHSRFHFSVDFQEKLPEEIERIKQIMEEENIKRWAWQLVNVELTRPDSRV
ncbi:MAG: ShlB/FhaC/HecB family hemolysin secretion/activation protein, partial [Candidatus Omnitrophota bacterium]|nr:ShlB/FhaC/HecB family hemolysin secretion/activation protein [Candidatus Omnitrophota bacterium]